ncbi:hypothetical protein [Bacillus pumilus]|uniref:hypothetical protein n=1 Tax=Bacillus pumilus TaxID=1408 RepID=UPI003990345B
MSAWIERWEGVNKVGGSIVVLYMSAWIERKNVQTKKKYVSVVLYMSAWIESLLTCRTDN